MDKYKYDHSYMSSCMIDTYNDQIKSPAVEFFAIKLKLLTEPSHLLRCKPELLGFLVEEINHSLTDIDSNGFLCDRSKLCS